MSKWSDRAQSVRDRGTLARRDWNPKADSLGWRSYSAWVRNGGKKPERENFCHYWRIALIWGPLRWVTQPLRNPRFWGGLGIFVAIALAAAFIVVLVKAPQETLGFILAIIGIIWAMAGIVYGVNAAGYILSEDRERSKYAFIGEAGYGLNALGALFFSPVLIVLGILGLVGFGILGVIMSPFEEYDVHHKLLNMHPKKTPWINPFTGFAAAIVVAVVISAILGAQWAQIVLLVVAGVAAIIAVAVGVVWTVDIAKRYNDDRRDEAIERYQAYDREITRKLCDFLIRERFEIQHPRHADNQEKFDAWLIRYSNYIKKRYYTEIYDNEYTSYHLNFVWNQFLFRNPELKELMESRELQRKLYGARTVPVNPNEPSRFRQGLRQTGEFCSFVWSVVLTTKWKTCPMAELPAELA